MYYRNRLNQALSVPINQEGQGYVKGKPDVMHFEGRDLEVEDVMVLRARVQVEYHEDDDAVFEAYGKQIKIYAVGEKAIKQIVYHFEEFVTESFKGHPMPEILAKAEFEVHENGFSKRLPQSKIGGQSLWSYGGTYSMPKLVGQVHQTYFYVVPEPPYLRFVQRSKDLKGFCVTVCVQGNIFNYENFLMTEISEGVVELHFKRKDL